MLYALRADLEKIPARARVIFRVDANITPPVTQAQEFRLKSFLPTLQILLKKECTVTLITHCDRPTNVDLAQSTVYVSHWLEQQEIATTLVNTIDEAQELSETSPGLVIVLENIRFWPEEQLGDEKFALKLAGLGDYYVSDAFGSLHNNTTSVALLPKLFDTDHKTIGLLIEKELEELNKLRSNPAHPYYAFLGGGKPTTKLQLLAALSKQTNKIFTMPLLDTLQAHEGLHNPEDYLVQTIDENLHTMSAQEVFSRNDIQRISIGPKTVEHYIKAISSAKTVFCNGLPGFVERPETLIPAIKLLQAMANSQAYTLLAGGDTVALAHQVGLADKMNFCSTGGGATLTYLANQRLPGLEVFNN